LVLKKTTIAVLPANRVEETVYSSRFDLWRTVYSSKINGEIVADIIESFVFVRERNEVL
jgi:hypothetical protein